MKTLALLSLSLAVALGIPPFAPGVAQNPVLTEEDQRPLLGDWVPEQGPVVVDDPLPQVRLGSKEQQEPVDMEQSQSMVELEVKVKPEVGVEKVGEAEPEVKKEPAFKAEPQVKPEPEVKVEQEGKENPEVKDEQELKAEPEVKVEQDGMVGLEIKVKPEVKVEQELKAEPEVKVEQEGKENPEVKDEQELKAEPEVKVEPEVMMEPEIKVDLEANVDPEVLAEPEVNVEPELKDDQDFKVESKVKVEPNVQEPEVKALFNEEEVQEQFQVQMNLGPETETGREFEERHIDMEMVDEPIMELEPLDDDNMFEEELSNTELSEVEKSLRAAFQNQDQPLPEEEELMSEQDYVLNREPIVELEPETREESFLHQQVMQNSAIMEEGPAFDIMGQQMPSLGDYFPNEEARMGMDPGKLQDSLTAEGSDYLMMEEPGREFVREEELSPVLEDNPVLDGGVQTGVVPLREKRDLMRQVEGRLSPKQDKQGWSCSSGVILEGKCYRFFKGPKRAADAEFFCQEHFPGGHLASITSQHIHREVMNMMLWQNGAYTRTWIGGLRYLDTGRFVWLDGSRWGYADWLSGEPNNTADLEDCVEVLAHGNGKFNDFTCWEPQAFICSYTY
ncbi:probable serine/threonine-protein kinase kinX isoform X2 [Siniperca chuatsi]|uniref:probable serine/threonine-protein kinase kinX isoform X2 n=1 Tax=Siniperca chuatsi TaxID=119488 RepID=UPI001CE20FFA|nr:probable serine/threonine-protein kinase kinX isoform X2 [Siniperca chuatsi]